MAAAPVTEPEGVVVAQRTRDDRAVTTGTAWAGVGGLVFAATIVVQNVLRGAGAPSNQADPAALLAYFTTHRATEWTLVVLFTVGAFGLSLFAGGVLGRSIELDPRTRTWAQSGILGVAGIVAVFSAMVACEVTLLTVAGRPGAAGSQLVVLWTLHNALFAVLTVSIAVALLGLSRAAATAGVTHRSFGAVGVVGAILLAVNTAMAPLITDTSSPVLAVGLVGFACWVAFVIATGYRLLVDREGV